MAKRILTKQLDLIPTKASLDELREAKASGGDLAALKSRLESAEKNFQEKLGQVDAKLQTAARQWDAALDGDAASRKESMAQLNELLAFVQIYRALGGAPAPIVKL